jgi:RNA ligase (TIGR02306 family)
MASKLVVPVTRIVGLKEHPNAAMLGLATVLGYQVVVGLVEDNDGTIPRLFLKDKIDEKGKRIPVVSKMFLATLDIPVKVRPYVDFNSPNKFHNFMVYWTEDREGKQSFVSMSDVEQVKFSFPYKEGDLVVYIPADTILTDEWAEKLNVKSLLKSGNRVGKIALRGEPSFGLIVGIPEGVDWKEGDNVVEYFDCKKYDPPIRATAGDTAKRDSDIDPYFDKFTDIQNLRIFMDVFQPGEEVIVTEKIEGTNCRLGYVNGRQVAGSMELRRKRPSRLNNDNQEIALATNDSEFLRSTYWFPWSIPEVDRMLVEINTELGGVGIVELFGEVYGSPVCKGFKYDAPDGRFGFKAFGLKINDKFLDWDDFKHKCDHFGVLTVPVIYRGPFDKQKILELAEGPTTMGEAPLREGVVVYPKKERLDAKVGRVVLKVVGNGYSLLKGRVDFKDT